MYMQDFDFDRIVDRRGSGSYKWDSADADDIIPLWVADMDFTTAPVIIDALRRRVDHGVFGYTRVPDQFYQAVIDWFAERHAWTIHRQWMLYTSGVVPAVSAIIKALAKPGDKVVVPTPAFNCFFSSIRNNGCVLSESPLNYVDGRYCFDFDDLEAKTADPAAKLMILCNPQNPGCRVWTPHELTRVSEICARNGVVVIADEIHCELTFDGCVYTPFASISEQARAISVTCLSPSKAFNTAGLQIAVIVSDNAGRRRLIDRAINDNEVCDVNPFGVVGLIAAYQHGGPWLDALKCYIWDNYLFLRGYLAAEMPMLRVVDLEGTYLAWIDCRALGLTSDQIERLAIDKGRVWVSAGTVYGHQGEGFIRVNLATRRALLAEGLRRLVAAIRPS